MRLPALHIAAKKDDTKAATLLLQVSLILQIAIRYFDIFIDACLGEESYLYRKFIHNKIKMHGEVMILHLLMVMEKYN